MSSGSGGAGGGAGGAGGEAVPKELAAAFAEANAQMAAEAQQKLTERMLRTCFERCVTKPEDKLADRNRRCLDQCTGAYLEGFGLASQALGAIFKKEGGGGGLGAGH